MSIDSRALIDAIGAWRTALGAAHVLHDDRSLTEAGTATFQSTGRVLAILRPGDRGDVQAAVRIANEFGIPVYPVSSGKNWGYGSRAPVRDAVMLDLSRLNRIVAFDEELAYVTLEPGVTQRQLYAFLQERGSRLWMDATGASPDCSIIGNTMERGFGHTPMGDHCSNVCGFEVVLPTGACVDTGFAAFGGASTAPLSRWGVGPSIDGLFSQSNLGIVTRLSVWLMPAPERFEAFFFMTDREDGLAPIIDALRPLRMNGTLRSVMHIGNDYKVLAGSSQFPWSERPDGQVLDEAAMERIRAAATIGCWNGAGGLYGTAAQVREAKRQIRRALRGKVTRLQFVDDRLLGVMRRFASPFRWITGWDLGKTLSVLVPVYDLLKGVPTDATMPSCYWRKSAPPPPRMDPDLDGCGLLWCSPVVPNTGRDAVAVASLTRTLLQRHGFEPQMSISLATERMLICVITISYDRARPGEDDRAMRCYRELSRELIERGYPPYRLGLAGMEETMTHAASNGVVQSLKEALDPNAILAPGRYAAATSARVTVPAEREATRPLVTTSR